MYQPNDDVEETGAEVAEFVDAPQVADEDERPDVTEADSLSDEPASDDQESSSS